LDVSDARFFYLYLTLYQRLILGCVPLALPVFVQLKWCKINTGKASGTPNFI
jgi:hypothetical protein